MSSSTTVTSFSTTIPSRLSIVTRFDSSSSTLTGGSTNRRGSTAPVSFRGLRRKSSDGLLSVTSSPSRPPSRPRSRLLSSYLLTDGSSLVTIFSRPKVLSTMLRFLNWKDSHSLSCVTRIMRKLFDKGELRHVLLTRFVPGYHLQVGKSMQEGELDKLNVTLLDLERLMLSESISPHHYPTKALELLSSLYPFDNPLADKYQTLTSAHSKFILLLRSVSTPSPSSALPKRALSIPQDKLDPHLPELQFPAPLWYFSTIPASQIQPSSSLPSSSISETVPIPPFTANKPAFTRFGTLTSKSLLKLQKLLTKQGRSTLRASPPQPRDTPLSLQRHRDRRRPASTSVYFQAPASANDDMALPPSLSNHYRFSSLPDQLPGSPSSSGQATPISPPSLASGALSPLDLAMATSPSHAPIIRVFVPSEELNELTLRQCRQQLENANLWFHLHVGDIVVNLGYVPPFSANGSHSMSEGQTSWLIFTGRESPLIPFNPTQSALPFNALTTIPTPFYYTLLLPSGTNPLLHLSIPPLPVTPQLDLVYLTSTVPSVGKGCLRVKKYAFLGRFDVGSAELSAMFGSGGTVGAEAKDGWKGEWIVESDGTHEGQLALREILKSGAEGVWEVVGEKCVYGRIWLRLVVGNTGVGGSSVGH